jgi:hypothetical protein
MTIITLCGSTRFTHEMLIKQWELTKQGHVVMSWCALPDDYYKSDDKTHVGDQEGVKEIVDEVHKRKIDLSDKIIVLNIGGYIGDSTRSEIEYAIKHGKDIEYLEPIPFWNRPGLCPHFRHVDQGHAICRRDVPYPGRAPDCSRETCEGGKDGN